MISEIASTTSSAANAIEKIAQGASNTANELETQNTLIDNIKEEINNAFT